MYLILTPEENRIMYITEITSTDPDGFYVLKDGLRIHKSICTAIEISEIPDNVEPEKWCYINEEFVPNPNWVDPEQPTDIDYDLVFGILKGEVE